MSKFAKDLAIGRIAEKSVKKVMGGESPEGHFKDYDLKVEVKNDKMCALTGNVCIELEYDGVESGRISGSDILIYSVAGKLWNVNVESFNKPSLVFVFGKPRL